MHLAGDLFLAQRLVNAPLALDPRDAPAAAAALSGALAGVAVRALGGDLAGVALGAPGRDVVEAADELGGIAIIRVRGLLAKDGGFSPDLTGYSAIRIAMHLAVADPAVRGIVLNIGSPGGEVPGVLDLVDAIAGARGSKPIWAILDESATSGAYLIASAADRVLVPRTGSTGGVGLVMLHVETSRALDQAGVVINPITFGKRKLDGSPFFAMTPAARARFQHDIDTVGALFVDTVARNRRLKPAAVRALAGGTLLGAAGVRAGLADAVASPDAAFAELLDLVRRRRPALPAARRGR